MKFVLFYHSLVSDWNHGNAHFLRGIVGELIRRGHAVEVYEPRNGWSATNLRKDHGENPIREFSAMYPLLESHEYDLDELDLDDVLDDADVVLVHEWNEAELVERIGRHRARRGSYRLFFHDTHHRIVTAPDQMSQYDLRFYDGVLAFGRKIRDRYRRQKHVRRAWTWHEAADAEVFRPRRRTALEGDLVWIGNWGDEERSEELERFLIEPVRRLGLKAKVFGVRYPDEALAKLEAAGIEYGGWLPNYRVPETFARFAVTIHVPRRPYREDLPGIPTIRVFEALACGIPLVSLEWDDVEGLFTRDREFLSVDTPDAMTEAIRDVLDHEDFAAELVEHGRRTIDERHTCRHRVDELLDIVDEVDVRSQSTSAPVRTRIPAAP